MPKLKNSNATFWVIFKYCVVWPKSSWTKNNKISLKSIIRWIGSNVLFPQQIYILQYVLYGFEKVSRGVSGLNLFRILGTKCWFNSPGSNGPKQTLCAKNPINIPKFRRENFINAFIDGFTVERRSETKGVKIKNSKIILFYKI